jgi:signal transduction histidine kinase
MLPPHRQAFSAEVWQSQPIQDFQAWREQDNQTRAGKPPEEFSFLGALPDAIGAWLAVPMQLDEGVRALMVVHSPYRFHFTRLRCHLLRDAARRLLPPLAAALRESKTRGAFTAAVMHEVKTDTNAALEHCRLLEEHWGQNPALGDDEATKRLDMVKHYLEGLSELGRDFLDVLRPGGDLPSRFQEDIEYELSQCQRVLAREWLDNLLRAWRWLYQDKKVELRDGIGDQPVVLAAPALLRRVARVLLQNAYRHGEGEIEIQLDLADHDGRACLQMRIANLAYASVAAGVQGGTSATTAQIGPAPQARARVGLANAIRLAQAVGGSVETSHVPCKDHTDSSEDEPMHRVSALLLWPLADPISKSLPK